MAITNSHYRRADGALLVCGANDRESFERLPVSGSALSM